MKYTIEFSHIAFKSFQKLPKSESLRILKKTEMLIENPYPNGFKKLQGEENLYRIRSGDYRILYKIYDEKLIILVVNVGHRKEIYK